MAVGPEVQLPYAEVGDPSGIPVVCLHGLPHDWTSFRPIFPHLPQKVRVIAPSQRGFGAASRPPSGYAPGDLAGDIVGLLNRLGVEQAVVVGHSMGSMVAQHLAIDAPDRLLGLVLVGTGLSGRPWEPSADEQALIETILALTDPVDPAFVRSYNEIFLTPSALPSSVTQEAYEELIETGASVPARAWHDIWHSLLEDDITPLLDGLDIPTLIVYGDADPFVPREDQDGLLQLLPQARLEVYPHAGHLPHGDDPRRFVADLVGFVEPLVAAR